VSILVERGGGSPSNVLMPVKEEAVGLRQMHRRRWKRRRWGYVKRIDAGGRGGGGGAASGTSMLFQYRGGCGSNVLIPVKRGWLHQTRRHQ